MTTLKNEIENNRETMNKETYLRLVKEFKDSTKNKDLKPYWGKDWLGNKIKIKGDFIFEHYIFYALLRNKNPEITTHDVSSESYIEAKYNVKNGYSFGVINKIMPSLTKEMYEEIVSKI